MTKAQWAVIRAAKEWHKWLTAGMRGADYRAYCRAFKRLERAAKRLYD
jgi:hypothetical protein